MLKPERKSEDANSESEKIMVKIEGQKTQS